MSVVAIDIGSSRIKALLADWEGRIIETRSAATPSRTGPDGESSYPADQIYDETAGLLAGLAAAHADDPVDTIVFSCLGTAMVPVDPSERPLGPALSPADRRPNEGPGLAEQLAIDPDRLRHMTGSDPAVASFALHLLWWKERRPDVMERLYRFRSLRGFVVQRLCGVDAEDPSWASRTMLMDLEAEDWSESILAAAGVSPGLLPRIQPSTTSWPVTAATAAELGLAANARIVLGGMDNCMSFLGASDPHEPGLALVVGTYEHIVGSGDLALARTAAAVADGVIHKYVLPGRYISMTRQPIGLLLAAVAEETSTSLDVLIEAVSEQPTGQSIALRTDAVRAAVGAGVSAVTIVQGLLEAAAMVVRRFVEAWEAAGQPARRIAVVGGGAAHARALQLKANLLDRALSVLAIEEGSGIGALRLAAVAVKGLSPSEACELFGNPIAGGWGPRRPST